MHINSIDCFVFLESQMKMVTQKKKNYEDEEANENMTIVVLVRDRCIMFIVKVESGA
jgi:hypothetical protein